MPPTNAPGNTGLGGKAAMGGMPKGTAAAMVGNMEAGEGCGPGGGSGLDSPQRGQKSLLPKTTLSVWFLHEGFGQCQSPSRGCGPPPAPAKGIATGTRAGMAVRMATGAG
mmetsp:Transcript_118851/g.341270  ORF Transcript_118851/g.341270 Transcript_118851/m.341270 type:complete len:110 (-) Transcript_118851:708-1037(-)